jgi:hypothetical protein
VAGSGFRYRSPTKTPDGLLSSTLKPGLADATRIIVKGKGDRLDLPPLARLPPPVTVQWRRDGGGCWGATYSTPISSSAEMFKSRND